MNLGHRFMLVKPGSHMVLTVSGVTRIVGNERLKMPKRMNVNGNSTFL